MKIILFMMNVALLALMGGLYYILDMGGTEFALGFLFAGVIFQLAYRSRHGHFFDITPHKDD